MTFGQLCLLECWHKIGRAEVHLDTVAKQIAAFLASNPYSVFKEHNSEQGKCFFRLKILRDIDQINWSLIAGDCVHNARSALDYIAWRLAGSDLNDRRTIFPIYIDETIFRNAFWKVGRMHKDALAEIAKLQPYTRRNPKLELLWFLQELDARDKHKLLTMTKGMTHGASFGYIEVGEVSSIRLHHDALNDGAIVAEVDVPIGTPESKVKVQGDFIFDVMFEPGVIGIPTGRYPVRVYLSNIISEVKGIVWRFESLINANPDWIL